MMPEADDLLLLLCTCADDAEAEKIARLLVTQNLAACVQLAPIRSIYRWQGQVEQGEEVQLLAKTCADRLDALTAAIVQLHPYELPEILALTPSAGLPAYLDWIRAETREDT